MLMPSGNPVSSSPSTSSLSTESDQENENTGINSKLGVKKFRDLMSKEEDTKPDNTTTVEDKDEMFLNTVKLLKLKRENRKKFK